MKFLKRNKNASKHILVISDLHLSAGPVIDGRRNLLEEFHSDKELVDFFKFFSTGEYAGQEVEVVINGDFLDLLAVPYVEFFADEFWSEKASLEKLDLILKAHPEVMDALKNFVKVKNKKLIYIIGNHDAELVFDSLKEKFLAIFDEEDRSKVLLSNDNVLYNPVPGIYIQHGHEYEVAHQYNPDKSILESSKGEKYFLPSWGSYYVTRIVNKYKQERSHVNEVKPIYNFLIHGLIFDTFFTLRLIIANCYYFIMVRFMHYYRLKMSWKDIIDDSLNELVLFEDYEKLTREFFKRKKEAKLLVVGHTHKPTVREYNDGTIFVNTGTWARTVNLDLTGKFSDRPHTFAHIQIEGEKFSPSDFHKFVDIDLYKWSPKTDLPYEEYC